MSRPAPIRHPPREDLPEAHAQGLARLARATARSGGPELLPHLVRELAGAAGVPLVVLAVPASDGRGMLRTVAVHLDGQPHPNFDFPLRALPGIGLSLRACQVREGALRQLQPGTLFSAEQMDALAVMPVTDSAGESLGLLAAMQRRPMRARDAQALQGMLEVVATRAAAEIERARTEETLRAVALAVSASGNNSVFDELVRLLATILQVEAAFIAQHEPAQPESMRMLAMYCGGKVVQDRHYPLAGTPCATVLGQSFRAYPSDLQTLFPADRELVAVGAESYAGHPLTALDGTPLGIVSVASRRPLAQVQRVKATLKIFAVRAAAEVERLRASEAQKQSLEDLRQREQQYRAIFEGSLDSLFLWDDQPKIVDVNPAGLALYGYSREEMIGKGFPASMPAEYVRARMEMVRRALAGGTTHVETTVLRPDGSTFEADLRVMPFVHRGRPHALAVVRDISERRRRDRELLHSEEQYRTIFNASVDALVLRAADFSIVDVNATYEVWTGRTRAEVLGIDRVLANPPEISATIRALHQQALAGHRVQLETQLLHVDGQRRDLELRGVPVLHRGQPHVLYMGRDISDAKVAEQRRAELERQLRQAQKMEAIGQLTGGLAHDFNNILTSVLGYVEMAQERPAAAQDAVLGHDLAQARLAAERAREHVAQLLAYSRPRRGERRLLAAAHVTAEALQLLRPNLPSSIAVDWDGGAGDALVPPVLVDPVQFDQVLLNLCINARDAIGEHGTIRLRTSQTAASGHCTSCSSALAGRRWVAFEVTDDGGGTTQDVVDRMFEPFFTTKEVGRGTGMGLAMVHGIVHDHGGHIQVRTAPGRGSTFRVLLPEADAGCMSSLALPPRDSRARPPLRGRVLLVEDEAIVSDYMQDLMRGWGLEVVLERDPLAAARRLAAADEAFALLLTDQTMPGMTGLALARQARAQRPGLPVLLYTGNASDISQEELSASGVTRLLRKPIDTAALQPLLSELLAQRPA